MGLLASRQSGVGNPHKSAYFHPFHVAWGARFVDTQRACWYRPRVSSPSSSLASPTPLAGWGLYPSAPCHLVQAEWPSDIQRLTRHEPSVARGLGRSYGDPAVNSQGQVISIAKLDRYLGFDEATGTLVCESGVSLEQIIKDFAPRGWFPAITPGTKYVTIGGCIANDIHGKAHHAQGSFVTCVDSVRVLLANGELVNASREENADLFWGLFGGLGLLGFIIDATIRLRKIESSYFRQKAVVVKDLKHMLEVLDEYNSVYPYSVAYADPIATGNRLGQGVVSFGEHATPAELPPKLAKNPLAVGKPQRLVVPFMLPTFTLNWLTRRIVNLAAKTSLAYKGEFGHYEGFFYPLDAIGHWNRGYGKRGFTQYQYVIPLEDGYRRMREIFETIVSSGNNPFLNVLKRLGPSSGGVLSFPDTGYTFAIDFPVQNTTSALTKRLDAMVLDAGGRIYLGKDAFIDAETFAKMYPNAIDTWHALKRKYDPENRFTSNLGRRVGLC
jgi:decaprenylphospho-beta-D-ribofuranose 2-oxidase